MTTELSELDADKLMQQNQYDSAALLLENVLQLSGNKCDDRYEELLQRVIHCNTIRNDNLALNRQFQQLLSLQKMKYGSEHERTMMTRKDFGIFLAKEGNYVTAHTNLSDFCNWFASKYGESTSDNEILVIPRYYLGKCYLKSRFLLEAKECFQFCYTKSNYPGSDMTACLDYGAELGNILSLLEMSDNAIPLLLELYSRALAWSGINSTQTVLIMNYLALAYIRDGQLEKGKAMFQSCIELKKEMFGEFHQEILLMYEQMIAVAQTANHIDEAMEEYLRVYKLFFEGVGSDDSRTRKILQDILLYMDSFSTDRKWRYLQILFELQQQISGLQTKCTLDTQKALILLLLKMDRTEECRKQIFQSLQSWTKNAIALCYPDTITNVSPDVGKIVLDVRLVIEKIVLELFDNVCLDECVVIFEDFVTIVKSTVLSNDAEAIEALEEWAIYMYYRLSLFPKIDNILHERYLSVQQKFGADSFHCCKSLLERAHHLRYSERYASAIEGYIQCNSLHQRWISENKNVSSEDSALQFEIQVCLHMCYLCDINLARNVEQYKKLYESCRASLGDHHLLTLIAMANYAFIHDDLSVAFFDSLNYLVGPFRTGNNYSSKLRDRLHIYVIVARIHINRKELAAAISILQPLVDELQTLLGYDFLTLEAMRWLGESYYKLGKGDKGSFYVQLCFEKSKVVRGDKHLETVYLRRLLWERKVIQIISITLVITFIVILVTTCIVNVVQHKSGHNADL